MDDASKVLENYERFMNPGLARVTRIMGLDIVEERSEGSYVFDTQGNKFLDFAGGYGVFSLGHRHPKVVEAVRRQLDRLPLSTRLLLNPPAGELAALLGEISPGDLQFSFFCHSGTEAVEGSLKLARMATGRTEFVSATGGFHGKSLGSLSVSGRDLYRKPFQPLLAGVTHVPFGDAGRLEEAVTESTAAVILEPIQGEAGIIVPPDDYLPEARRICSEKGALLILDEVQTGLGRTGSMFASEHWNVSPDIMTLSKALGGGVMPLGAFMGTPEAWRVYEENPLMHTSTIGGGPLAFAAGIASIKVILEEDLPGQAREKGDYMLSALSEMARDYTDLITAVRGKGLMIGIEFKSDAIGALFMTGVFDRYVLAIYTLNKPRVIRITPPLNISREDLDRGLEVFRESLDEAREFAKDM